MAKRKYTYGKGSSEWKNPGDYYVDDKWKCYYTDTVSYTHLTLPTIYYV